jgi:hypothetical protein
VSGEVKFVRPSAIGRSLSCLDVFVRVFGVANDMWSFNCVELGKSSPADSFCLLSTLVGEGGDVGSSNRLILQSTLLQ